MIGDRDNKNIMEIRPCSRANCVESFDTPEEYVTHMRLHDGGKHSLIHCPFVSCEKRYVWSKTILRHLKDEHSGAGNKGVMSQDQEFSFTCSLASCYFSSVTTVKDMRLHLLSHTDKKESVPCPFKSCSKSYRIRGSLTSHFSRCHRNVTAVDVKGSEEEPIQRDVSAPDIASTASIASIASPSSPTNHSCNLEEPVAIPIPSETAYSNALCDFYNVIMHEKKIPYDSLDYIVKKLVSFQVR